jgi:CRP-like cAMP-binding protein
VDAFVKRAEQTLPEFAPAQNGAERPEQTREQPPAQAEAAAPVAASATLPDGAPALPPRETAMTTPDTAVFEALRKSRLAKDLTAEQTQVLASVVSLATFRANDILAVEGTTDNHLYEVVEGSLGVVKHRGTPDETMLVTLQPRDFAHELGFLDGAQRFASLVAATDARVLVLERTGLESLIDTHPRIVYRVMCAIVQTVHRIQTRLSMHATELTNYIVKQHGRY